METLGELATKAEDVQSWMENNVNHWKRYGYGIWIFYDKETGNFVGRGGLRHDPLEGKDEIEIEYALMPEYWGKGLGTEIGNVVLSIAEQRQLHELVVYTQTSHAASIRIIEKLGFTYEKDFVYGGSPHVLYRKRLNLKSR